jgi:hypothetical protein
MRVLLIIGLVLTSGAGLILCGCGTQPQTTRILEVRCKTELNEDKGCLQIERPGSDIDVTVNTSTQKVQLYIVRNDGNYWVKDFILDKCSIVDASNWKCIDISRFPNNTDHKYDIEYEWGMSRGRYYSNITGGGTPDISKSSISGLPYWAFHLQLIDFSTAVKLAKLL